MTGISCGFFGGAFDPPHQGHIQVATSLLSSGFIEQLWIVPALLSPGKHQHQATFSQRLDMCRLSFGSIDHCMISDIEAEFPAPSYTFRTLSALKQVNPQNRWFLCIGSDSLSTLHSWFFADTLLQEFPVLVVERPGFFRSQVQVPGNARITWVRHELTGTSSTEMRNTPSARTDGLHPSVTAFIQKNGLYQPASG